jgi:hypothetical protein
MEDQFQFAWRFGGIEITGCKVDWKYVAIPRNIGQWPVRSIGNRAFFSNQLTSVTIPDSVRSIGDYAFGGNKLTSVVIPNSVTFIGGNAFSGNDLAIITLPANVELGSNALPCQEAYEKNGRRAETYMRVKNGWEFIPGGTTSIMDGAFLNEEMTIVIIPDSVKSIGRSAFAENKLTSVTIPNGVRSIGINAFAENQLASVTIPDSVTSIGSWAFYKNPLTSITLPANVQLGKDDLDFDWNWRSFVKVYKKNRMKAGTYIWSSDKQGNLRWKYQE